MEFEITYDTQVILPIDNKSSRIIENNESYVVNVTPMQILEHSCEYFGSSFNGRKDGTKKLLGITHKSPIIIEESRKIIFFPTTSPERTDCIWINLEKINKYYKSSQKKSIIEFKNGDIIEFEISIVVDSLWGARVGSILWDTSIVYFPFGIDLVGNDCEKILADVIDKF